MTELNNGKANITLEKITDSILASITLGEALLISRQILLENQSALTFNDPKLEAKMFVEFACSKTQMQLITHSDEIITTAQKVILAKALFSRINGLPVAYIIKHQAFWTLDLHVSEHTLIPRADSEIVVETALGLPLPDSAMVVDLGTGTGAIALAIKAEKPQWEVLGTDLKTQIIELARLNAKRNHVDATFLLSHWFAELASLKFDLIVSNPPYVESDSEWLQQGDVRFEPDSALSSGIDGLDDIRHIVLKSPAYLNDGGYLLLEHGHQQAEAIQVLMLESGFSDVATKQDLNGLNRATIGCLHLT